MADTYTSSLRVRLQANGANDSTWGGILNTGALQLLEDAISGRSAVTHDDTANYSLTTANGSADEARRMILNIGGALTAARNTVCPTQSKFYVAKNATTGGYATTLKTTAGTGITIPSGKTMLLFCDGTNVVEAIDCMTSPTFVTSLIAGSTTMALLNTVATTINFAGGASTALNIGHASGTNTVLGATTFSQAITLSAALTYGGVALSNAVTGTGNMVLSTSPTLVTPILGTPTSGTLTNCTFPTLNQNTTGSAATLTTPRAINGVNFDGSAAITVTAAAGTLSGTTLAAGVVTSSLTTVGALDAGSITSGFGSIDVGADAISGGAITGTTGILTTSLNVGAATTGYAFIYGGAQGDTALPTYSFIGDTNTGMVRITVDTLGFSTGGTTRLTIDNSGGHTIANLAGAGSRAVNADANGLLSAASDSSLKSEVVGYALPGLKEILQLKDTVRAYQWNKDIKRRGDKAAIEIGFFANLVAPIIPSAAPKGIDGLHGFYDRSVTAALVNATWEIESRLRTLEARLN